MNIRFYAGVGSNMKKKSFVKVVSENGEIHFVLREHTLDETPGERVCIDDVKVATVQKKEASKPLMLARA